jgi:hypothetical protein
MSELEKRTMIDLDSVLNLIAKSQLNVLQKRQSFEKKWNFGKGTKILPCTVSKSFRMLIYHQLLLLMHW